MVVIVNK